MKILTIQLQCFAFSPSPNQTNNSLKLNHHVQFPFTLPLSKYMAFTTIQNNISEPKLLYQLYGVIVHSGTSLEDGHYYSYIQSHKDLQWYKMNDKSIQQVHPNEVLAAKAYLLFYKQNKEASNNAPMSHFPNDFSCHKSSLHPQGKKSKPPKNPTNSASPNTTQQLYSSNLSNLNVQTSNEPKLQNIQKGNLKTAHSQWNMEKTYNKSSLKANKINTKSRRPLWSSVQKFRGHIERQTIKWEQHYKWNQKMLFEHSYRKKSLRKLKNATAKVRAELQFRNIDQTELEETQDPLAIAGTIYAIAHLPSNKIYTGQPMDETYNRFKSHWHHRFETDGQNLNLHCLMAKQKKIIIF